MKRKLALLLAVVMMLSVLPMGVFGRNEPSTLPSATNQGETQAYNLDFVDIEFNTVSLAQPVFNNDRGVWQTIVHLTLGGSTNDSHLRFTNVPNNTDSNNGNPVPASLRGGFIHQGDTTMVGGLEAWQWVRSSNRTGAWLTDVGTPPTAFMPFAMPLSTAPNTSVAAITAIPGLGSAVSTVTSPAGIDTVQTVIDAQAVNNLAPAQFDVFIDVLTSEIMGVRRVNPYVSGFHPAPGQSFINWANSTMVLQGTPEQLRAITSRLVPANGIPRQLLPTLPSGVTPMHLEAIPANELGGRGQWDSFNAMGVQQLPATARDTRDHFGAAPNGTPGLGNLLYQGFYIHSSVTAGFGTAPVPGTTSVSMTRGNDFQTATLVIESLQQLPNGATIRLYDIPLRASSDVANPWMSATTGVGTPIFTERPLGAGFGGGVAITASERRNFQQALIIPYIDIREVQVNALTHTDELVISLVAPRGYSFNTQGFVGTHVVAQEAFRVFGRNAVINNGNYLPVYTSGANQNIFVGQTIDGLQVLQFRYTGAQLQRNQLIALQQDTLRIESLVLVAGPDAPATGDVDIEVHVARQNQGSNRSVVVSEFNTPVIGPWTGANNRFTAFNQNHADFGVGTNWPTGQPAPNAFVTAPAGFTNALSNGGGWRNRTLGVGHRSPDALQLTIQGDLPELMSGRTMPVHQAATGENINPEIRTAEVRITETALGALGSDWNNVLEFHFDHQGVQLLGAAWRIRHTTGNTHPAGVSDWQFTHAPVNPFELRPTPDLNATFSDYVWRDGLYIFLPRHLEENLLRRIEVRFFVSIEAGFEWRYGENEISVRVDGSAARNLAENNREIVVADVVDPITFSLDGAPLEVEVGQVFNMMEPTTISDLVITETHGGALQRGQRIELQVDAFPTAVLGAQSLSGGIILVDEASGMRVRQITSRTGIAFEVEIPSNTDTPATITITEAQMMGTILPGVHYVIGLYGSAAGTVQRNYLTENMARSPHGATFGLGNVDGGGWNMYEVTSNTGFFQTAPAYLVDIMGWGGEWAGHGVVGGDDATAPGPGGPGQFVPGTSQTVQVTSSLQIPGVVGSPLFFDTVAGHNVGFVSARAFAYLIGSDPDTQIRPNFPQEGQHTIEGLNTNGETVTIVMQTNSATVSVNGEVRDIAGFAPLTGPSAGQLSVVNRDGNLFLPFRFFANAFGYNVEWVNNNHINFRPF